MAEVFASHTTSLGSGRCTPQSALAGKESLLQVTRHAMRNVAKAITGVSKAGADAGYSLSTCEAKLVLLECGKHVTERMRLWVGREGKSRFICGLVYYSCMRWIEL